MSNQLPSFRIKLGEPVGNEIFFAFPEIQDNEESYLDTDVASGVSSLSANGLNFSSGDYIVIGQPGFEKTEIAQINGSPTATAITLSSALKFAHNRGDLIQFIPYNQISLDFSTDSGSTYSTAAAVDIRPDASETYLQRASDTSTYVYRFRFYNSTTTLYSAYSDTPTASGYADNSVFSIKERSLDQLGEKYSDVITSKFLNDSLAEGRRMVDQNPSIFRWSFRTKFNTSIGTIKAGAWSIAAPTDLRDRNTRKNILNIRIGRQNRPLSYQDKNRFNQNYLNVGHTTLNGAILSGATSITLTSSGDFDESGSISIGAEDVLTARDAVAYTANNESTNVITGVTGVDVNHASGRDVWQNATFGLPLNYTIVDGVIYFDVPFGDDIAGENIYMDYYSTMSVVVNDNSTLDEPFYDLYVPYLRWKIKYKKANGALDAATDTDYKEFVQGIGILVAQETPSQFINFIPDINGSQSEVD